MERERIPRIVNMSERNFSIKLIRERFKLIFLFRGR